MSRTVLNAPYGEVLDHADGGASHCARPSRNALCGE